MTRYRRITERLRRPLAAIGFLLGVWLLVEAIWLDRGDGAYLTVASLVAGSLVAWLVPWGGRAHPPSESTLQWARRQRGRG
ncbi:MAG TPA: hypothetical protein VN817_03380 [Solirubrobacteraceae bacterium]|nr:hypothetical protein [Solirubrobacteraceae bacterium]